MIAHAYAFDVIVRQSDCEALAAGSQPDQGPYPQNTTFCSRMTKATQLYPRHPEDLAAFPFTLQKEEDGQVYRPLHPPFAARQMAGDRHGCLPPAPLLQRRFPQDIGKGRPLPERPHRQVHDGVQRKNQLRNLQRGGRGAVHLDPLRQKGYPQDPERTDAGGLRPAGVRDGGPHSDQINAITKVSAGQRRWSWTRRWRWTRGAGRYARQRMRRCWRFREGAAHRQAGVPVP